MPENLDDDAPPPAPAPKRVERPAPQPPPQQLPVPVSRRASQVGRTPPHSLEAEQTVIGCMWLDGKESIVSARDVLKPDDFYAPDMRLFFEATIEIFQREGNCDDAMVVEHLKSRRQLESAGGLAKIMQVTAVVPTTVNFQFMVRRVRDLAQMRRVILEAQAMVEAAYTAGDPRGFLDEVPGRFAHLSPVSTTLVARGVLNHRVLPRTDRSCLLGNRYLNRGDGLVLSSSAGMGKSSISLQMAILWSLGREAFGIKPNGALTSLIFQAEDSEGDIGEVVASIVQALKLTPAEQQQVNDRVLIITDRVHRGKSFIAEARAQIAKYHPDLVWVNPLASFAGRDISDAETAGEFLREELNGLNADCQFGWVLVHHTTKPPSAKEKGERKWNEIMYDMAGSYDLIGWARAIMSLRATDEEGQFELVLAKRGKRADVKVETESDAGVVHWERVTTIPLQHSSGTLKTPHGDLPLIYWETRVVAKSEQRAGGRPKHHRLEEFYPVFPVDQAKALGLRYLHRCAKEISAIGNSAFENLIKDGVTDGLLGRDVSNPRQPKYWRRLQPSSNGSS